MRIGNFEDHVYLDMAFGHPLELDQHRMPSNASVAADVGASLQTVQRARTLVVEASLMAQDKGVETAVAKAEKRDCVHVLKLGWGETTDRMFCNLEKARHVFPEFNYGEQDVHNWQSKHRNTDPKPSFRCK